MAAELGRVDLKFAGGVCGEVVESAGDVVGQARGRAGVTIG